MDDGNARDNKDAPTDVFGAPPLPPPVPTAPPTDTVKLDAKDARAAMPRRRDTGSVRATPLPKPVGGNPPAQALDPAPVDPSPPLLDSLQESAAVPDASPPPPPPPPPGAYAPIPVTVDDGYDPFGDDSLLDTRELANPTYTAPAARPVSGRRPTTTRISASNRMRKATSGRSVVVSNRSDRSTESLLLVSDQRRVGAAEIVVVVVVAALLIAAASILVIVLGSGGSDRASKADPTSDATPVIIACDAAPDADPHEDARGVLARLSRRLSAMK